MLLERASGITAKIHEYQKLKGAADKAAQFETRAKQLETVSERIANMREALNKFAAAGITVDFSPNDGTGYAAKARKLRTALQEDPAAINDPSLNLKYSFIDRLAGIARAAEEAMGVAWRSYVDRHSNPGSDEMLSAFDRIPQFQPTVSKIRTFQAAITALGHNLPDDPAAAVERLNRLEAEQKDAWNDLSAEDLPHAVMVFIRLSTTKGAPLSAYTDEVQSWLESQDIADAFRIKLR